MVNKEHCLALRRSAEFCGHVSRKGGTATVLTQPKLIGVLAGKPSSNGASAYHGHNLSTQPIGELLNEDVN
jgi:hypothetical protein